MKNIYIFSIAFLACLFLAGCSDDNDAPGTAPVVELQQDEVADIPFEGQFYEIPLTTTADWTAVSQADWCTVYTKRGSGNHTLVFRVEANLGEAREGEISVYAQEEEFTISLKQQANAGGGEFKYRIPIVFHVIYNEDTPAQNPEAQTLYDMLDEVNRLYANAGANSVDMNMEFVLAQYDPNGNKLDEPGIDRVYWPQEQLDPTQVMEDRTGQYKHFIWEPNEYVNILLYPFSVSEVLGISTFPYNPAEDAAHQLTGLEQASIGTTLENLNYVHGVSLNSLYLTPVQDAFMQYVSDADMKELMGRQSSLVITLAHELGHYFGLRHTFTEVMGDWLADTDYCTDTGSYIRSGDNGYEAMLSKLLEQIQADPSVADGYDWESLFWRDGDATWGRFQARNIMDYAYCYLDEFTPQQRDRVRFVLEYSPLIPGPKKTEVQPAAATKGMMDLPVTLSDGYPLPFYLR